MHVVTGMLSLDGRCKTLDAIADGYVRAENCIVLLLEALSNDMSATAILQGSAVKQVMQRLSNKLIFLPWYSITSSMKNLKVYWPTRTCSNIVFTGSV